MIFSVTYREILTDETTSLQEHTTTFEAPDKNKALGTIVDWMSRRAEWGGIVQVLKIDVVYGQEEP